MVIVCNGKRINVLLMHFWSSSSFIALTGAYGWLGVNCLILSQAMLDSSFFFFKSGCFSYTSRAALIFLCREFLLHIPYWLHFYLESFSYTSRAAFISCLSVWSFSGLHITCWLHFYVESFPHTSRAGFVFIWEFLLHIPCLASFSVWGVSVSYRSRTWLYLVSGEFLLHIPCWLFCCCCLFSFLILGVSLTHPMLASFLCGSFSYTSRAGFIFIWGVSLTHPGRASFIFIWGVFLTHPALASFIWAEFLHIPCWLCFCMGSFCYTSRVAFIFMRGVSLTHPVLPHDFYARSSCYTSRASFVSLTHPVLVSFFIGSFSYTSHAGFVFFFSSSGEFLLHIPCCRVSFFIWGVSLTHPMLASFLSGEFLLHIPCRL